MNKDDIKNTIHHVKLISCNEVEYKEKVRGFLHEVAGEFIDSGDGFRGQIALMEVKRLDGKFSK